MIREEQRYMIAGSIETPTATIRPAARSAREEDVARVKHEIRTEFAQAGDSVTFSVTGPVWRKVAY